MKNTFFKNIAGRYLDGTISDQQKALVDAYFDNKQTEEHSYATDSKMHDRILDRVNTQIASAERSKGRFSFYWAAAAVILVLIAALIAININKHPINQEEDILIVTKKGEKKKITLPDGSSVMLNSQSQLSYSPDFDKQIRNVNLTGEAYFDIRHNPTKPFIVHSKKIDVKVLGTLFNVKAYEGETTETSLIRGSVQIFLSRTKQALTILKPNEKFIFGKEVPISSKQLLISKGKNYLVTTPKSSPRTEVIQQTPWVQNRLSFDNQGFTEVAVLLERWYNIQISIDNPELLKYRFTGTFNDTGIIDVLKALQTIENFKYRKEGNKINIY